MHLELGGDVISDRELQALCSRFAKIKSAIKKELGKPSVEHCQGHCLVHCLLDIEITLLESTSPVQTGAIA